MRLKDSLKPSKYPFGVQSKPSTREEETRETQDDTATRDSVIRFKHFAKYNKLDDIVAKRKSIVDMEIKNKEIRSKKEAKDELNDEAEAIGALRKFSIPSIYMNKKAVTYLKDRNESPKRAKLSQSMASLDPAHIKTIYKDPEAYDHMHK